MSELQVTISGTVGSAMVVDNFVETVAREAKSSGSGNDLKMIESSGLYQSLQSIAVKLDDYYAQLVSGQKASIAKLSVEIARKILSQKVSEGDYEIESIITESLSQVPERDGVIVHLHPEDMSSIEKLCDKGGLEGVKFVGDERIGKAECLLETGKSVVECFIENNLEQIGNALSKAK